MGQMQGELKEGEFNSAEIKKRYCFREVPKRLTHLGRNSVRLRFAVFGQENNKYWDDKGILEVKHSGLECSHPVLQGMIH